MINIKDSFRLAFLKFKTYKVRSILTSITLSIGVIAVLTVMFAVSGITVVGKQAFKDTQSGKRYISIQVTPICSSQNECKYSFDQKLFSRKFAKYDISNYEPVYISDNYVQLDGLNTITTQKDSLTNNYNLQTISSDFANMYLLNLDKFNTESDIIPVIIPETMINTDAYTSTLEGKDRYDFYSKLYSDFVGKEFLLNYSSGEVPTLDNKDDSGISYKKSAIKVVIVGIIPEGGFTLFPNPLPSNVFIPNWAVKNSLLKATFGINEPKEYFVGFKTETERNDLVNDYYNSLNNVNPGNSEDQIYYITSIISKYEIFIGSLNVVQNVIYVVAGFLFLIASLFVFTTLNKIASDGRKEIAIFRSFGATRGDIKSIYNTYIFCLITFSYLLGVIISIGAAIILSVSGGDAVFYSLINSSSSFEIIKPIFIFLNFPFAYMLIFLIILYLIGFIASFIPVYKASRVQPILALKDD